MNENYITIFELLILAAIWYALPLIIVAFVHLFLYWKWSVFQGRPVIAIIGMAAVAIFSPVFGAIVFLSGAQAPHWLNPSDNLFFHPLAFLSVVMVSIIELLIIYGHSKHVQKA